MNRKTVLTFRASVALSVVLAATSLVGGPGPAAAQGSYSYSTIDCSTARFKVPFTPKQCRESNVVAGGNDNSGSFQRSDVRSEDGAGYYIVTKHEGHSQFSYILVGGTVQNNLTGIAKAKNGKSWSEETQYGGGKYAQFTADTGENCIGLRKPGPYRKGGYAWVMWSVSCLPRGERWTQASIQQYFDAIGSP